MIKKILIGIVGLLVVLYVVGLTLSPDFNCSTSTVVQAPAKTVYDDIATLETWLEWSVWNMERDPDCVHEFPEPKTGVGAKWIWKGSDEGDMHSGELVITEADPATGIKFDLNFEGMPTMPGSITLAPEGDGTKVTFGMSGAFGGASLDAIMFKYMNAFGLMESMMREEYDENLANLKRRAEEAESKTVEASAKKK